MSRLLLPLLLAAVCALPAARAQETLVTGVTVDLSQHSLQTLPAWVAVEETPDAPGATAFHLAAPQGVGDLAVTFYFRETNGACLAANWTSPAGSVPLSANLCEGVALPNQRTLLIPRDTVGAFGTLTLQSADDDPLVDRVRFDWTVSAALAAVPGALVPGLLRADGSVAPADELDGQPVFPEEDAWQGRTVTAPLNAVPERVERGVAYYVDIAEAPRWARLDLLVAGLPLDGVVSVWVNGRLAGRTLAETPDLNDPGITTDPDGRVGYAGWRRATLFVPAALVYEGENVFQFSREDPLNVAPALAVKDVKLQLRFHDTAPAAPRWAPPRPSLR